MAIISCPACGQRVSSRYEDCPHCGHRLSDNVETAEPSRPKPRLTAHVEAQGYLAILLTVGGVFWYYRATSGLNHPPENNLSIYLLSFGVVWYVGLRAWMIYRKWR